jgi:hypothetical protein
MEVHGFFDSAEILDSDLRAGKYDDSDLTISVVNWEDLSMGALLVRTGTLGEVVFDSEGGFRVEVRGMIQRYNQRVLELYSPTCRADLGDTRCTIPIKPTIVPRSTPLVLGEFYRAASELETNVVLLTPGDIDVDDKSVNLATGTRGNQARVSRDQSKFGEASLEFSPTGAVDPSLSFISYPDLADYSLGSGDFTIEGFVQFKNLSLNLQVIASHWLNTGNQRAWALYREGADLKFIYYTDGTSGSGVIVSGTWTGLAVDTWYHVAIARQSGTIRLFLDGAVVASPAIAVSIHNSTALLHLGKWRNAGGNDQNLNGYLDDFRMVVGSAEYTGAFTAPTIPHPVPSNLPIASFDDRMYEVTVAGTTAAAQPAYDTTVPNTTVDGGATLTAREAWMRAGTVATVTNNRLFTVTLTETRAVDGWFKDGTLTWETGSNAGLSMEVKEWTQTGATIELFLAMPFDVQVGDLFSVYAGCDKTPIEGVNGCKIKFDNLLNFRGEEWVPGNDRLFSVPDRDGGGS